MLQNTSKQEKTRKISSSYFSSIFLHDKHLFVTFPQNILVIFTLLENIKRKTVQEEKQNKKIENDED